MARTVVAIVSWNTRALLERALRSLEREDDAEVWVVDNASADGSAEMVRERFGGVRLLALDENVGFGRAVNRVASVTRSDWLLVANADVALRPGALAALHAAAAADPGAGAVAPRLVLPGERTQHSAFAFPTLGATILHVSGASRAPALADRLAVPGRWKADRARRVPWAVAACLLVRRAAWADAGGFDERQWMYAEDLDLGWRLRDAGWATRYEPRAIVDHESAAATTQAFGAELEPHWQRATYGCIARRRGPAYARAVALLNALGARARGEHRWAAIHAAAARAPAAALIASV